MDLRRVYLLLFLILTINNCVHSGLTLSNLADEESSLGELGEGVEYFEEEIALEPTPEQPVLSGMVEPDPGQSESEYSGGTLSAQVEAPSLECYHALSFYFSDEVVGNQSNSIIKSIPLYSEESPLSQGKIIFQNSTACTHCRQKIFRVVSLGEYPETKFNQPKFVNDWFKDLINGELDEDLIRQDIFYQDFQVSSNGIVEFNNFVFTANNHYLFLLINNDPNEFDLLGEIYFLGRNYEKNSPYLSNIFEDLCYFRVLRFLRFEKMKIIQLTGIEN